MNYNYNLEIFVKYYMFDICGWYGVWQPPDRRDGSYKYPPQWPSLSLPFCELHLQDMISICQPYRCIHCHWNFNNLLYFTDQLLYMTSDMQLGDHLSL